MIRLLKVLAILVVLAVLAAVGILYGLTRRARGTMHEVQAKLEADARQYHARINTDEARWKNAPLLTPHTGGDAASLLFAHMRWERDKTSSGPVPERASAQLKDWGADWAKHADDLDLTGADLSWMAQLRHFGFWDLEGEGSPIRDLPWAPFTEPLPNFIDLQGLAKARLAQGLVAGSTVEAASEVRELARLCMSTENLVGEMLGVALLGIERRARDEALRRPRVVDGWTAVSEEDQQALRRVLWVAPARFSLLAASFADTPRPLGECAGLQESLGMAYLLRGYLYDELPDRYTSLTNALNTNSCRMRRARLAWAGDSTAGQLPVQSSALCQSELGEVACAVPEFVVHVPFVRGFIGSTLAVIATPDWFRLYRPDASAAAKP